MQAKYALQLSNADYAGFISKVPIMGTWDDHDYGVNDGGKWLSDEEREQETIR